MVSERLNTPSCPGTTSAWATRSSCSSRTSRTGIADRKRWQPWERGFYMRRRCFTGAVVCLSCALLLPAALGARSPARSRPHLAKERALEVAKAVLEQTRRPNYHSSDTVSVLIEIDYWRIVLPLKSGASKESLQSGKFGGVIREWAYARTNILDRKGQELAQGGASLYRLERVGKKHAWRFKAADEGNGIAASTIRKLGVPPDVVKALGIEVGHD